MGLIELEKSPTAYILENEAELQAAFRVRMSAWKVYRALAQSEKPPPMSYRQFCRLTEPLRQTPVVKDSDTSVQSPRSSGDSEPSTPGLIPRFQHRRAD